MSNKKKDFFEKNKLKNKLKFFGGARPANLLE